MEVLTKADDAYYNSGSPIMTDKEYDQLRAQVEMTHGPLSKIGAPVHRNKVALPCFMGSMNKIKSNEKALRKWTQQYPGPYVLSAKLDGISALLIKDRLYTRGDGSVGQDISHLLSVLPNIPSSIPDNVMVRGELIMPTSTFNTHYSTSHSNARNIVSGIIHRNDVSPQEVQRIHFVAYEVVEPTLTPHDQFLYLIHYGFQVPSYQCESTVSLDSLSETFIEYRTASEYAIDGLICTDDHVYERLPMNPKHSFAFKMQSSDQEARAVVEHVIWEASKDGLLKPRVRMSPVVIQGVKIEYATGFNAAFIERHRIGPGAVVQLIRSGDVIPHIASVIQGAPEAQMPLVPYSWNKTHIDIIVENKKDHHEVMKKNIHYFFSTISVEYLGEGTIARIFQAGKQTISEFMSLTPSDLIAMDGFQKVLAEKICDSIRIRIEKSSLVDLMTASNVFGHGIARKNLQLIVHEIFDLLFYVNPSPERLIPHLESIHGIGHVKAVAFATHFPEFLRFLYTNGLLHKIQEYASSLASITSQTITSTEALMKGERIVISGFRNPSLEEWIISQGGNVSSTISSKTTRLIVKDDLLQNSKTKKANELQVMIQSLVSFQQQYHLSL